MTSIIKGLEVIFERIPLPLLEIWGRFGYFLGLILMVGAFGGFTFRAGGRWGLGRVRQTWDAKALLSVVLTFVLVLATGYLGSFIVLVPGAQTFESLKDLSVFLCICLFGYPALLSVPFAYGLSDLIEGVPPAFLQSWLVAYFINPACFWVAHQLFGKNPDFRRANTWGWYLLFVLVFMSIEPQLWGYVCAEKFTPAISYRNITPALFFTTSITWLLAPPAMLGALPLARKLGLFWADIAGHAKERRLGHKEWIWESGTPETAARAPVAGEGVPIRMFLATPFILLVLLMVGATAYVTLRSAEVDANKLASRLHQEIAENISQSLDAHLGRAVPADDSGKGEDIDRLLREQRISRHGRAFIIRAVPAADLIASSFGQSPPAPDAIVRNAVRTLHETVGDPRALAAPVQFRFDIVTAKPLARETWLTQATPYRRQAGVAGWILMTALPEAYFLEGVRAGHSQSAMVLAVALTLSILIAALLAAIVTAPIRRISRATEALAHGDRAQPIEGSRLEELGVLAVSFNNMSRQLTEYTERLKLATSAASLGVWDWDVVKDELVWDDEMYRQYGLEKSQFSGAFEAWTKCLVPEDWERAQAAVAAALEGSRPFEAEFGVRWPDGSVHIIKGIARTMRDAEGRPLRMVGVNYDITERKRSEQELLQHRDHLEKLVADRTAALSVAVTQAEQATQAKSEFLANMSHEIRTPMNAILGMTNLALRTELTEPQRGYLAKAKSAAESLLEIISDILDFSKIEAGKLDMEARPFALDAVLDKVVTVIGWKTHEKGLELRLDTAADVPATLIGDPLRLEQVLINLCTNAVKFSERGEVLVVIRRLPASKTNEVTLQFSVRDSGIGLTAEQVGRLFRPFSQADASTTRRYGGTGLGLAICRQLVELMGGTIGVKSVAGQGSDFHFTAVFATSPDSQVVLRPMAEGPAEDLPNGGLAGRRVLLVEDNELNQMIAVEMLRDAAGIVVVVAQNGEEAVQRVRVERFDAVLMDVQMPVMDGYQATELIRKDRSAADLPIIAMTANAMARDRDRSQAVGMNDYVTKPFDLDQLLTVLHRWIKPRPAPAPDARHDLTPGQRETP